MSKGAQKWLKMRLSIEGVRRVGIGGVWEGSGWAQERSGRVRCAKLGARFRQGQ